MIADIALERAYIAKSGRYAKRSLPPATNRSIMFATISGAIMPHAAVSSKMKV